MLVESAIASERTQFQPMAPQELAQVTGDIVTVANSDSNFSTLVSALQAADLVNALQSPGPFTVFAPTNAAFDALPPEVMEALLLPENQSLLTEVLTYHVVPGELRVTDLSTGPLETLSGDTVQVNYDNPNAVTVNNDADIFVGNIPATNGVIHAIDQVLVPDSVVNELQAMGIDPNPTATDQTPTPRPTPTPTQTQPQTQPQTQTQGQPQATPVEDTTQPVRGLW